MLPAEHSRILGLSFQKEIGEKSFFEFEKQLCFGITQILKYFSPLELVDCGILPQKGLINKPFQTEEQSLALLKLGQEFGSQYVMFGAMEPEVGPTGYLDAIVIELCLYDTLHKRYPVHLSYYYSEFTSFHAEPGNFSPSWEGFQDVMYWLAMTLVGAVYPEQLVTFTRMLQNMAMPDSYEAFEKLSQAHYLSGDSGLSHKLSMLFSLTQEQPDVFIAHLELGHLYKRLNSYNEAINAYERAYGLMNNVMPRQAAVCATEVGVCHALMNDDENACRWWELAIKVDPSYLNPYMNWAHSLEELGHMEQAEMLFLKASEIAPQDSRIYFNLARIYSKLEQWEKVITQYEHQLVLEPSNPWVYSNLANCHLQKGDIGAAKVYLLKTFELDPHGEAGKTAYYILENLRGTEVAEDLAS